MNNSASRSRSSTNEKGGMGDIKIGDLSRTRSISELSSFSLKSRPLRKVMSDYINLNIALFGSNNCKLDKKMYWVCLEAWAKWRSEGRNQGGVRFIWQWSFWKHWLSWTKGNKRFYRLDCYFEFLISLSSFVFIIRLQWEHLAFLSKKLRF